MTGPGPGGRGGMRAIDEDAVRVQNAAAPDVAHLGRRIVALFAPYRAQIIITCALVMITAAIGVVPPLLVERVFDDALFPKAGTPSMSLLMWLVLGMIGLYLVAALLNVLQAWFTATIGNRITGDLRVQLFEHLQSMELGFFTRTKTGVIQSRLQNDVGGVSGVLTSTVTSILGNVVTVIASLVAMVLIDWRLTLVSVAIMPILTLVQRRVGRVRAKIAGRTQESLSELTAITQETLSISGVLLSKSFNRQRTESVRYQRENANQIDLQVQQAMSGQTFFAVVQVLMSSVPAVIYLIAGFLLTGDQGGGITAGAIVAFTTVQARLLQPLVSLMRVALDVQTSRALFARIFEYLDLVPQIEDDPDAIDASNAPGPRGSIALEEVTFRFPDAADDSRPTLDDISFRVEPGQHVALVGPSGSGKSTILYLIPRLYDATSGAVRFDGADVTTLTAASIIDEVGIVAQETYLFHATIADNLRYAKPDATDEELRQACIAANIDHIITGFEQGYDTMVGERGYRLSGGEKQRIAIARVLLKDPPVLLLDEATSALDTVSERVVQEALDTVAHGRTTITVAHRLSTIVDSDVILVVDAGRIVESGTHTELMARNGLYTELAEQQLAAARIDGASSRDQAPLPGRRADRCPEFDDLAHAVAELITPILDARAPVRPVGSESEWPPAIQ
ncbi:ABC transporter ATP-binding protein [Tsukamurella pseudospumae]|uniref:Fatty acid ABC transporter ATP-binding/permease protein n=1 Tax=Tsukamurella pseudospumae TaxID=239498 RepID=A0A137ZYD2_9ACTN|nr:ABC transporter ATP-binding protein [Tsukamurella pseudospumae]KXO99452.1 multidrug ABC transporter ATP-binding protein [Tsukamurella pseudospumae]KXP03203.1 multidrug ABC transporter ATP-binding protein [Tsukamurella pseudospumae]